MINKKQIIIIIIALIVVAFVALLIIKSYDVPVEKEQDIGLEEAKEANQRRADCLQIIEQGQEKYIQIGVGQVIQNILTQLRTSGEVRITDGENTLILVPKQ